MPSIVGGVKINSVGSSGIVNFGDLLFASPKSVAKTFAGSGSFVTGDFPQTNNAISATNTSDTHLADQNIAANT